ncbi:MAG: tRNA-uridine aminocarboxypropyltransferase [Vibrio sp.]
MSSSEPLAPACPRCRLQHQCLCDQIPALNSQLSFALLTHPNEVKRSTNSGQLIADVLPNNQVHLHIWQRKEPPEELIKQLKSDAYLPVLLYPNENSQTPEQIKVKLEIKKQSTASSSPKLLFIILDATWQEAKKILNKSSWLDDVCHLKLEPTAASSYALRRNQKQGHLCTCEVGIELLKQFDEPENAAKLDKYMQAYFAHFEADRSGHALKPSVDKKLEIR